MGGRAERWAYFLTLLRWAIDGLVWAWPVTAALVAGVIASAWHTARKRPQLRLVRVAGQVALLVVPLLTLALGAGYACENCSPSALGLGVRHYTAMRVANALFIAQLLWAVWSVYAAVGRRVLAAFVQAFFLWCTLLAGLMAGMSMSGDWL